MIALVRGGEGKENQELQMKIAANNLRKYK